jgi:hypothetical protein
MATQCKLQGNLQGNLERMSRESLANDRQSPPDHRRLPHGRACEWSRSLVLHTSGESEDLHVAHPVKHMTTMRQMNFCMTSYR